MGWTRRSAAGARLGVTVIPGIEVNTDLPGKQGEAHVLGYYLEYERPAFQAVLRSLREARARRGERMVERLRAQGWMSPGSACASWRRAPSAGRTSPSR